MTQYLTRVLGVAVLYLAVTSNLEFANVMASFAVGVVLAALLPAGRSLRPSEMPRAAVAGLQHAVTLVWDVLLNGLLVAKMVAGGRRAICPGFVRVKDRHDRELASALEAHAITISPGQLVVSFEGRRGQDAVFEVHCLDTRRSESDDDATGRARVVGRLAGVKERLGSEFEVDREATRDPRSGTVGFDAKGER